MRRAESAQRVQLSWNDEIGNSRSNRRKWRMQGISAGEAEEMVCLVRANLRWGEATPAPLKKNRPEGVCSKRHVPANGGGRGRIERKYLDWAPKGFSSKRG